MRYAITLVLLLSAIAAHAAPALDAAKAEAVVARCGSIYHESGHPCACPSDRTKTGRLCGRMSAHDRPGGAAPICLASEVTPELLADFRTNEQAILRVTGRATRHVMAHASPPESAVTTHAPVT